MQPAIAGYIAASPTLPLADRTIFAVEREQAGDRDEMPGVLFLSLGGRESPEMRQGMIDLATALRERGYAGLTVRMKLRHGQGHGGNNWQSYVDGVRWMHDLGILT